MSGKSSQWPAIIFLMTRQPRTIPELMGLTGMSRPAIYRTLKLAEAEGLVAKGEQRLSGTRGGSPNVWRWER